MSRPPSKEEKEALRRILEVARDALAEQLQQNIGAETPVELDQNRQGRLSRMDALQGQAMLKAGLQRNRAQLKSIQQALARLEKKGGKEHDEFGRCLECGDWIPIARLQLNPTARYCVTCAVQQEQR